MDSHLSSSARPALPTWVIVASGIIALSIAMGIGRFAFTPLMPLMLRDGTLTPASGAEWAAANYAGYLAGALTAAWFSGNPQRGLRWALFGVALSTIAIAAVGEGVMASLAGAVLRAAAGVFSAWALVCASSWCLGELARRREPALGAWIYTGVGLGIVLAGMLSWLGGRQPASWLWFELGGLALVGAAIVGTALRGQGRAGRAVPTTSAPSPRDSRRQPRHLAFVFCYGAMGFGYILPATFLPAMAREQVSDPLVFGITWPVFGLAAALSVAVAARWMASWPRRQVWALAQAAMAVGTALPVITQALWALAVSATLVGGTIVVVTMAGLQLARELVPSNPTPLQARMTVAFAAGQIAGPLVVRFLPPGQLMGLAPLDLAGAAAALLLAGSAVWLWLVPGPTQHMADGDRT